MTQKRKEVLDNNNNNNENNQRENSNNENISPETNEEISLTTNNNNNDNNNNNNGSNEIEYYIGQKVDVLDSVNYWTEAEIIKIDQENKKVYITYLHWSSRWDEWIDLNSNRIAPFHTHTYNPPNPLQLRQRIEVLRLSEWREAFVVEESLTQVKVHYRNIPFQYDEWIDRSSQRIRKFGLSKTIKKNKKWAVPTVSNSSNNKRSGDDDYNNENNENNNNNYQNTNNNNNNNNSHTRQIIQSSDRYNHYIQGLQRFKLEVFDVSGDGNCLFRSVSHQIYGDDSYHLLVREKCMDYMEVNSSFFSQFVIGGMETFSEYLRFKRMNGCWGDDPEIQAMCEIYDQPAQIWAYDSNHGARCLRTFHEITSSRPSTATSINNTNTTNNNTNNRSRPSSSSSTSSITSPSNNSRSHTTTTNTPWWRAGNHSNNNNNNNNNSSSTTTTTSKSPIRLSYYGGGHYDSLISTRENNTSSGRRSYPTPGIMEDRAISRAKERVRLGLNSHLHTEEAKRSTDIDATEIAELELALEVSRNHLTEWEDDIDACLLLSTQETSMNGLDEFKDGSDLPPQLLETQQQMLQTAVEQSEREYLEKALEESLKTATNVININNDNGNNVIDDDVDIDITDATLMESVYQESLNIPNLVSEGISHTNNNNNTGTSITPTSTIISPTSPTTIDSDVKLALELSQLNEDEILQRVLQESLNNSGNNRSYQNISTTSTTTTTINNSNNNNNNNLMSSNINEDEQLQEAIRISMMNQYSNFGSTNYNNNYNNSGLDIIPDDIDPELEMAIQASFNDFQR